ncbi:MAG TPA: alkaline phosphatase family protein [Candidatus Dormibacteraeota bacterium]|jgi:acid phosphatase
MEVVAGRLRRPRRLAAVTVLVVTCSACGAAGVPASPPGSLASPRLASGSPAPAPPPSQRVAVAVIVMENQGYDQAAGLPYIHTLASVGATLTNYRASSHPSLPNYLALTSGTTWGITDDGYHVLPPQDVGDQLTAAAIPWRAYMEGMGSSCRANGGGYAVKHDPFAYYGGRCPSSVVPFSELTTDLSRPAPPRFMWISPNLCHDMHGCPPAFGDAWLRSTVPAILGSPAMSNGVLFITWDEDDGGGGNHVLTLVLGSKRPLTPAHPYSHPSLLASVQDLLGLPRLPATAGIAAITMQ